MLKKIIKEPLFHFLLLGGLIFVFYSFLNKDKVDRSDNQIILQDADIERLGKAYQQNWNSMPDTAILKRLLSEEIKSEIFYREALQLNLDHNDEIIRRRLKQKYEFLIKDLVLDVLPTNEDLENFYKKNHNKYKSPPKISFHQIYFNPDTRNNPLADAQRFLQKIKSNQSPDYSKNGDQSHLQTFYGERDFAAVRQAFGKTFAEALFQKDSLTIGWQTPITSGYGIHLVNVSNIQPGEKLAFTTVKNQLIEDWQQEQLTIYNEKLFQNLLQQYEVIYDFEEYKKVLNYE